MSPIGFHLLSQFEEKNPSTLIRRYLDISKFNKLVETNSLFFSPASTFDDQLEGHYTTSDYKTWDTELKRWGFSDHERTIAKIAKATVARENQQAVVITCWTSGEAENIRMWKEYGKIDEAVAIETTVGQLRQQLGNDFLIVRVSYLDFLADTIPKQHSLQPYCHKQNAYQWENEIRVIGEMEIGKRIGSPRLVAVDLPSLITRIITSPNAEPSFKTNIEAKLHALALPIPVMASSLLEKQ